MLGEQLSAVTQECEAAKQDAANQRAAADRVKAEKAQLEKRIVTLQKRVKVRCGYG